MFVEDKTIMVSGGTGQFGRYLVYHLLENGAKVSSHYRSQQKKDELLRTIPDELHNHLLLLKQDILTPDGLETWFQNTLEHFSNVDGVVHTVGGIHPKIPIHKMELEQWQNSIQLNLTSAFYLARTVLPYFIHEKKGKMVFISALAGEKGTAKMGAYSSAKAGLIRLAETISAETKKDNIQTNVVIPSIIKTTANVEWAQNTDTSKWVEPADLSHTMMFLLSEQANAITAATIRVTGKF